jgi:hypothetical protein
MFSIVQQWATDPNDQIDDRFVVPIDSRGCGLT